MTEPHVRQAPYANFDQGDTAGQIAPPAKAALSLGAIIGIAVGAAALVALLLVGAIALVRRKSPEPAPRRVSAMNIGETRPTGDAAAAAGAGGIPAVDHTKRTFAPTHAHADDEGGEADAKAAVTAPASVTGRGGATAPVKRRTPRNGMGPGMTSP